MKFSLLTGKSAGNRLIKLIEESTRIDLAVAWSGENDVVDALIRHRNKIVHAVFGTHMYRTDPKVLRKFQDFNPARYVSPAGDLFHPKVYLLQTNDVISAVVGSHNLTGAAFSGKNVEASLLLELDPDAPTVASLRAFIQRAWADNELIDEDFLRSYEPQYEINRKRNQALKKFVRLPPRRQGTTEPSPQDLTWPAYLAAVKKDEHFRERLEVIERASKIFGEHPRFHDMSPSERKAIAGTYGSNEETVGELDWGAFGTMVGQGDFKNLVNELPERLSAALDRIPDSGPIEEEDYDAFAKGFLEAFKDKEHVGGVATASRLLTMKRPDFFIPINQGNRKKLCEAIGCAPTTLTLNNYWDRILVPAHLSRWWNALKPKSGLDARIWEHRAAMLDGIYYRPVVKKRRKKA